MNYRDISNAVNYCKAHDFFYASSAFLLKAKSISSCKLSICLIFMNNNDKQKIKKTVKSEYEFIYLSVQDIFTMILQRDLQIDLLFTGAIPLLDNANIAPQIYSSITPIKICNKYVISEKMYINSSMTEADNSFSMLFYNVDAPQSFINKTFLPLCVVLKEQMVNCRFSILWKTDYNAVSCSVEIRFFSDKILANNIIKTLQVYLYKNVCELQLGRIRIPYYSQQHFFESMSKPIKDKTNNILCVLSEDYLYLLSNGGATDTKRMTMVVYYYIFAAKSFFFSESEFLETNELILGEMLDEGISPFSKFVLNHQMVSDARDKLLREYRIISDRTKVDLLGNYSELFDDWTYINSDDDIVLRSLHTMGEIRRYVNNYQAKNEFNVVTRYFVEFYQLLILSWNIPCYYRAYIPFCVKYLLSYEV